MPRLEKGMDPNEDWHRTLGFFLDDNDGLVSVRTPVWYKRPRLICSCSVWADEKTCDHCDWVALHRPHWEDAWGLHPTYLTPDENWRKKVREKGIPNITALRSDERDWFADQGYIQQTGDGL